MGSWDIFSNFTYIFKPCASNRTIMLIYPAYNIDNYFLLSNDNYLITTDGNMVTFKSNKKQVYDNWNSIKTHFSDKGHHWRSSY